MSDCSSFCKLSLKCNSIVYTKVYTHCSQLCTYIIATPLTQHQLMQLISVSANNF